MFKRNNFKSLVAGVTAAMMLCTSTAFAASTQKTATAVYNNIKIVVDGTTVTPKDVNGNIVDPFIIDGTTYLPVRALANALGQGVEWDQETSTVKIGGAPDAATNNSLSSGKTESKGYASVEVVTVYNDIKIVVNDNEVTPTDANGNIVEPFIIDGTTYLPVRALANALGEAVDWDQATSTVYIGEKPFKVDSSILKQFSDITLATVGDTVIKGAYYNVYIAQNANQSSLQYYCDNYSADKNLQTLTINSVSAAKYLTEAVTDSIIPAFAIYESAAKNGFQNREDIKENVDSLWNSYRKQFNSDEEYNAFLSECGISSSDYENFYRIISVASMFSDDLYSRYMKVPYTLDELSDIYKENYVTAKHILVEDEATAKDIISKLKGGASFDELAAEYNIDPGYTPAGYTFTYGEMVPEFENAAFSLKENTFTQTPVKSTYGYHVILRVPIEKSWIEANQPAIQSSLAEKETNAVINDIISKTKVVFTEEYNTYASTIK